MLLLPLQSLRSLYIITNSVSAISASYYTKVLEITGYLPPLFLVLNIILYLF